MHDFKPYCSLLSEIPLLTCCEWRDCSCSPSPRSNGLNLHHYVTPIGIWVEIVPKSEKIKENCTFFFEIPRICNLSLAKQHINTNRYLRKGRRQQSAEEKRKVEEKRRKRGRGKGEKEKEKERFRCVSLARVCARAFQPQYCFFAVTSVTRWGKIR